MVKDYIYIFIYYFFLSSHFLLGRHNLFNIGCAGREIAKSVRDSSYFRRPSSTLDVQATAGLSAMSVCKRDDCKRGTWGLGPVACFCPLSGPHRGSSFFVWCTAWALHRHKVPFVPRRTRATSTNNHTILLVLKVSPEWEFSLNVDVHINALVCAIVSHSLPTRWYQRRRWHYFDSGLSFT